MLNFLNRLSAWLSEKLGNVFRRWLISIQSHTVPFYHEYIEGMFSDYMEMRRQWRSQNASDLQVLLMSIPWGLEVLLGIFRLNIHRLRRGISLFIFKDKAATDSFVPEVESSGRLLTDLLEAVCFKPEQYSLNVNENQHHDGTCYWILWANIPVYNFQDELVEIWCVGIQIDDPILMQHLLHCWRFWKKIFPGK